MVRAVAFVTFCLFSLKLLAAEGREQAPESATPAPLVDPQVFGLDIPEGKVWPGRGRRVVTSDDAGKQVVALVHARVGDNGTALIGNDMWERARTV